MGRTPHRLLATYTDLVIRLGFQSLWSWCALDCKILEQCTLECSHWLARASPLWADPLLSPALDSTWFQSCLFHFLQQKAQVRCCPEAQPHSTTNFHGNKERLVTNWDFRGQSGPKEEVLLV